MLRCNSQGRVSCVIYLGNLTLKAFKPTYAEPMPPAKVKGILLSSPHGYHDIVTLKACVNATTCSKNPRIRCLLGTHDDAAHVPHFRSVGRLQFPQAMQLKSVIIIILYVICSLNKTAILAW